MYEIMKATEVVIRKIDDKVKQLEEHLGSRGAKTYDEYCEMCGEIKGLLTSRNFLTDLTKNMENSDE
jgi:uncharacterized protein YaaR (DUF327 family)